MLKRFIYLILVGMSLTIVVTAHHFETRIVAKPPKNVELTLASFVVTRNAYKAIIPKFTQKWYKEHNQIVHINQSYSSSGAQTRAVIDGLPADIVHLAMALDTKKIEQNGLIASGWESRLPNNSIVSKSVVALVTRKDNPRKINDWPDLANHGVQIITAHPKTSGVARWSFLALWNAGMKSEKNEAKITDYIAKVYSNATILSRDARDATETFLKQGQGDALINYEHEVILAQQKGLHLNYVIPDVNVSIDNPITIVDKNVDRHGNREVVEAFIQQLFTPEAQAEFAKVGFRPVVDIKGFKKSIVKYPPVKNLNQVSDFGGWNKVQTKFFANGAMFDQIQNQINH